MGTRREGIASSPDGAAGWDVPHGQPEPGYVNLRVDDVRTERRQREIRECVERLARFRPTKLGVEVTADQDETLNREYGRYRAGAFELTPDEVHQLGFRIAAELDHDRIHAINWMGGRFGLDRVIESGRAHGQAALVDRAFGDVEREVAEANVRFAGTSIVESLASVNDPVNLRRDHQRYLAMARIGSGDDYVGADWVAGWYERNPKIYVNLTRITTSPQDRILVIIGSAHIFLLDQLLHDSGDYRVESAGTYLALESVSEASS